MGRNIGAGIAGIVIGGLLVWVVESLGHLVYPVPESIDFTDAEVLAAFVASRPLGALLSVIAAWFIGSFGGTFAACRIGTARPLNFLLVVGGAMFILTSMNLLMIPHPIWMSVTGLVGVMLGAWLGMQLGKQKAAAE